MTHHDADQYKVHDFDDWPRAKPLIYQLYRLDDLPPVAPSAMWGVMFSMLIFGLLGSICGVIATFTPVGVPPLIVSALVVMIGLCVHRLIAVLSETIRERRQWHRHYAATLGERTRLMTEINDLMKPGADQPTALGPAATGPSEYALV